MPMMIDADFVLKLIGAFGALGLGAWSIKWMHTRSVDRRADRKDALLMYQDLIDKLDNQVQQLRGEVSICESRHAAVSAENQGLTNKIEELRGQIMSYEARMDAQILGGLGMLSTEVRSGFAALQATLTHPRV